MFRTNAFDFIIEKKKNKFKINKSKMFSFKTVIALYVSYESLKSISKRNWDIFCHLTMHAIINYYWGAIHIWIPRNIAVLLVKNHRYQTHDSYDMNLWLCVFSRSFPPTIQLNWVNQFLWPLFPSILYLIYISSFKFSSYAANHTISS